MVTTRSRVNKQTDGLDTAAVKAPTAMDQQQPTSTNTTTSPLKRKSGTTAPADGSPVTKFAKTDLDPDLDMNTEPAMPPVPAPTPVAASNSAAAKEHRNQPPHQQQLPASDSMSHPSLDDIIAAATAGSFDPIASTAPLSAAGTATAPSSNGNGALPVVATAPAPTPAVEASLEAMKEPEPESTPLPEMSTVLTEPLTQQQPPAPTAPALSTIAAPAPISTSTTTATETGPSVPLPASVLAATEDPTVHGGALPPSTHNNINGGNNGIVHPDAFAINPHVNAVDPADLTPMPSAPPLPTSAASGTLADQNSNKAKDEAVIAGNIGTNTASGGESTAPTAPVVAPSASGVEHKAADHHQQ
ncbi:hypothetical protein EC957_010764 [Mortierella hygrophila]|uniref:Uncharacterized protein n=1 Tax=Mortierella hygrophila TaxID=979708 RepID=A0A9P6FI09_9FUNG|nr:hypothetical protein EC957_010764 [Mortierella hygrophila]